MTQHGSTEQLTVKQQALLAAMLTGRSTEQAAKEVHISERTAYRWAKQQAFKEALAVAQQALFLEHLRVLKAGVKAAIATLARNMAPIIPPNVQVQAARAWLENVGAAKYLQADDDLRTGVDVHLDPEWVTLRSKLIMALDAYPEARAAVIEALAGGTNGHRQ